MTPDPRPFAGRDLVTGNPIAVHIAGDRIAKIEPLPPLRQVETMSWLAPGLVDLQVNGYRGIDLNAGPLSREDLVRLCETLSATGVTTFLPTLITAAPDAIEESLRVIANAVAADPVLAATIPGIHLEGPFISPEDGPRGAHPAAHVRSPDWELFQRWQAAASGLIRIVTLSPEWPEAPDFIACCRAAGVIPAIGHTAATPEQIRAAIQAGARLSTHLGNGAHALLPRHPNYLWEQLASDYLWASIIADGFHLPEAVLKVILRIKGEHVFLVSDATTLSGMPPGNYQTAVGDQVFLSPLGRINLAGDPRLLAGSAVPLVGGVAHLATTGLASLADAWSLASTRPAAFIDLPVAAGLVPGAPADLVSFHWDGSNIGISSTYKAGQEVFSIRNRPSSS